MGQVHTTGLQQLGHFSNNHRNFGIFRFSFQNFTNFADVLRGTWLHAPSRRRQGYARGFTLSFPEARLLPRSYPLNTEALGHCRFGRKVASRGTVTRDWPSERLPLNCAKRAGVPRPPWSTLLGPPPRLSWAGHAARSPAARPSHALALPDLTVGNRNFARSCFYFSLDKSTPLL